MFFSMRKGVSQGASTEYAAQIFSRFFVVFLVMGALSFTGCPMDDDSSEGSVGLDPNLIGTWEMNGPYGGDRYIFTGTQLTYGSLSANTANPITYNEIWSGYIRYSEEFSSATHAGVIIIEYIPGHKQEWSDGNWVQDENGTWVSGKLDPQPEGNFYGIYYTGLEGGDVGHTIYLSNTTLQDGTYGPTETETLDEAKARFTEEHMPDYISLTGTTPQTKVAK
ncbi:MAG: hypothetical protein LBT13_04295 [Treponema sp.]|jgi:hypothetical protein|nr:hypothetical protein [Treponema sp.]